MLGLSQGKKTKKKGKKERKKSSSDQPRTFDKQNLPYVSILAPRRLRAEVIAYCDYLLPFEVCPIRTPISLSADETMTTFLMEFNEDLRVSGANTREIKRMIRGGGGGGGCNTEDHIRPRF